MRFHMRAVAKDVTGYYYVNWDKAIPVVIEADTRPEAFQNLWAVMGDCPRGREWTWTAKIDLIEPSADKVATS